MGSSCSKDDLTTAGVSSFYDLKHEDIDGTTVDFASFRGKLVICKLRQRCQVRVYSSCLVMFAPCPQISSPSSLSLPFHPPFPGVNVAHN